MLDRLPQPILVRDAAVPTESAGINVNLAGRDLHLRFRASGEARQVDCSVHNVDEKMLQCAF